MKRHILTAILILSALFALSSCGKENNYNTYPVSILGTWYAIEMNGQTMQTDQTFVVTFKADGTMKDAQRRWSGPESEWKEISGTYTLDKNIVTESQQDGDGNTYKYEMRISIRNDQMYCTLLEVYYNGVAQNDHSTLTLQRVTSDNKAKFTGIWKGHESTDGVAAPAHDTYWQFLADGTYRYVYYDADAGKYVEKADNNGKYFLYGDFFASNYTNDLLTGGTGRTCEAWYFMITGTSTMEWRGMREDGLKSFQLYKASSLPAL